MTNRFLYAKCFCIFETAKDEQVLAKFSISSVDAEGAYKNLQAEMPGWNFDGVRADAKKKWNECLVKDCSQNLPHPHYLQHELEAL